MSVQRTLLVFAFHLSTLIELVDWLADAIRTLRENGVAKKLHDDTKSLPARTFQSFQVVSVIARKLWTKRQR